VVLHGFQGRSSKTRRIGSNFVLQTVLAKNIDGRRSFSSQQLGDETGLTGPNKEEAMRRIALVVVAVTITITAVAGVAAYMESASGQSNGDAAPIYGVKLPEGYRDWRLISVKRLTGKQLTGAGGELKQLRAELGNDLAIKAYRDGTLPFPDGAIIAALHWNEDSSDSDNQTLAAGFPGLGLESTFAGSAVNSQFMVKDSKKYVASGGWGFADFTKGKPGDEALHAKCFPCHAPAKDHDYVFTRYAPTPGTE
jgi:hypothetical protein